ncbi:endonuclease Q family protein [Halothermothrix orenii]|uniref:TIGR00375 family protein n=1 Tax=Halothermothrix orenii (strain H 168 / OCM 544 / DSM 9562) TaxID=373903 RepID=B8CVX2_HALOH|nr:endonuclease Q family protein [Halothermothrix orenii]ACL69441.1 conserved hypothetical protein TIGR00375 [Halothermothrix orenii H 168]
MQEIYADLHIHIGSACGGQPVKVTASRKLNFQNILQESLYRKGLNLVGIIDSASPLVINDIEDLLDKGIMEELPEGGVKYQDKLFIILGSEIESREENGGQAHYLAYFPFLSQIKEFSQLLGNYITNINLSSQACRLTGREILNIVDELGGLLIPAHAFTPHKSFYGRCFSGYREVFSDEEWEKIPAIELGLSADTHLADFLSELAGKSFLSNSDAHSLGKIAREYNKMRLEDINFKEFKLALQRKKGRCITYNYGLDPRLGKYYSSYCLHCQKTVPLTGGERCSLCGSQKIIMGVKDRIINISKRNKSISPPWRPPYVHQIPLADVPGVGKKTLNKLLKSFGTEMEIIHQSGVNELSELVGTRIAGNIDKARSGKASIEPGGGGVYGKVMG